MKTTMKSRILDILRYKNVGQAAFEKNVGLSNGYVNNVKSTIGADKIVAIINKYPEIDLWWLLTGKGEMLKQNIGHTTVGDNSPINGDINVNECKTELEKAMLKISHLEERLKEKDEQIAELKVLFEQRLKDKEEIIELLKNK